jgi:hypothetical protein
VGLPVVQRSRMFVAACAQAGGRQFKSVVGSSVDNALAAGFNRVSGDRETGAYFVKFA